MLQKNDTVALILNEARKIVEERGEAGLRVAELADRCGVAVGLLY
ncbi:MAG: TetR family transcriptional regulator, partial [Actinomycetota bacterium]